MTAATLRPPEVAGLGRGLAFALFAHGLLILGLTYGLNWRSDSSPAFEAELWSSIPQVAAPREEAPPEPEPEAPKPDPRAQQRAEEEAAEQQREAEIAIAKEKKRKEEKAREEREAREKAAKDKAAKEKAAKEEQDKKKEKDAKAAKEAKQTKEADAKREALRLENLRRIQGMAGGAPNSDGSAAQTAGPSAGWMGRVRAAIRRSVTFPGKSESSNPEVAVRVFLAPDGKVLGIRVTRASSEPAWDNAVERGIESLGRVPQDPDKRLPEYLDLTLRPHEDGFVPR